MARSGIAFLASALFAALVAIAAGGGPWCFQCDNVFHPVGCSQMTQCLDDELCFAEKHEVHGVTQYSSGCKPNHECVKVVRRSSAIRCTECCNGTLCNEALCQARVVSTNSRLWCASCDSQLSPEGCDKLELCSSNENCAISETDIFGSTVYNLGCESTTTCQGKTLANDKLVCCDQHLCNTNLAATAPDSYTSPPPTTTTPPSSPATADLNETVVDFVSNNDPNENLTLTCTVGGFPEPNVTWYFIPDDVTANGTGSGVNGSVTSTAASPVTVTTTTTAASAGGNTTTTPAVAGGNVTTVAASGNATTTSATTPTTTATTNNTTTAATGNQRQEVTSGVTTLNGVSTLVITSPDEGVAGQYICHAENSLGPAAESNATVTYAAAPLITGSANETLDPNAKEDVLLECEVEGTPLPDVHWVIPPDAGGAEELANGSLLLHNVHGDNTGDYVCEASNAVGNTSKTFSVNVDDNSTAPCPTQLTTLSMTTPTTLMTTASTSTTPVASTTTSTTGTTTSSTTPTTTTTTTTTTPTTTSTTPTTTTTTTSTTTPTTTSTTTATTTPQQSSTTPLVCPSCPPCPTVPSTTTPMTTPTTATTTTPTTTSTTATTTTPTTTTTTTTTTPSTTTTTATTTPSITTTTSTTTTTTTPSTTTTTPTTTMTTTTSTPEPYISAIGSLWHDSDKGMTVLQCNAHALPGMTLVPPVTWSRLEENFDHSDTTTFKENGHGVLVITPHGQTAAPSGVYQCHVFGGTDNDTAEFAVYKNIPGQIDCQQTFDMGQPSVGAVLRATCGPCQPSSMQNNLLMTTNLVCQSAVGRGLIQQTGGTVSWLIRKNNEVALLKEEGGHVKLIT